VRQTPTQHDDPWDYSPQGSWCFWAVPARGKTQRQRTRTPIDHLELLKRVGLIYVVQEGLDIKAGEGQHKLALAVQFHFKAGVQMIVQIFFRNRNTIYN
jgi:hypothetical protein